MCGLIAAASHFMGDMYGGGGGESAPRPMPCMAS
jgi:hypothetical protein